MTQENLPLVLITHTLPEGWLADPDDCTVPAGADVMHSGG